MQGRSFDDIMGELSRDICGTTKGQLRQTILWQDLDRVLVEMGPQKLHVLDAGGGEEQTVIKMAEHGHQVILCDLFAQMTDHTKQAVEAKGMSDNIQFIHCAAQDVVSCLETPADLMLFHVVLKWVTDPRSVLQTLRSVLHPDGVLSLMLYDAHGLLVHNTIAGNFDYVQVEVPGKKRRTFSPDYPRDPAQVYLWLEGASWQVMGKTGVRVFHDYLHKKHQQRDCYEALLGLETRCCRQELYITLGRYIHAITCKPQSKDKV